MKYFNQKRSIKRELTSITVFVLFCQTKSKAPFTEKPAFENVEKSMKAAIDKYSFGEIQYSELVERFFGLFPVKYQRNHYKNLTNEANLEATMKRYDNRGKASERLI